MSKLFTRRNLNLAIAMLAANTCLPLAAADLGERHLRVGGFGTLAALYHDEDGIEYRRSVAQPSGAEGGELDFATDSLAGVQINAAWNQKLELVVQGVTRLSAENDWRPQLTRAFVRYNIETIELRAGRIGWEVYPRADSRGVGYSQLTMRPTVEVYGVSPTTVFDGAELSLTQPVFDAGLGRMKVYGGAAGGKLVSQDGRRNSIHGSRLWGGHLEYLQGPWIARIGAARLVLDEVADLQALADGLRQTGLPQAQALAAEFERRGRHIHLTSAALTYAEGPLQAQLLAATVDGNAATSPDLSVGLLSAGYRLGDITPYAAFSFVDNDDEVIPTGLPDDPAFVALNAAAGAVQAAGRFNQRDLAVGLRYDFAPKLALKLQVDRIRVRGSALIFDRNTPPRDEVDMTLFGVALDFIF